MNTVKFSVFSDFHCDQTWIGDAEQRLDTILTRAKEEQVDFVIHCGDFCQNQQECTHLVEKYNNFELPTYYVLGNHDADTMPLKDVIARYKMPGEYYYFDKNGFRFIVLNSNYCHYEGQDIAYEKVNYSKFDNEYRDYVSQEQVKWLEETVMSSPFPMVLLAHNSCALEDDKGGEAVKNRGDIQRIIRKAHANGKRILLCLNGHLHVDCLSIYENVCYMDVNSTTMYFMPQTHKLFPEEYLKAHRLAKHVAIYNDPVHAIITLSDDGTIQIEGMKSSFFCDAGPEAIMGKSRCNAVKCTPNVLSEKLKLPMKL